MSRTLRTSAIRALAGTGLLVLALLALAFVLPDASRELLTQQRSASQAKRALADQVARLGRLRQDVDLIRAGQKTLEGLEAGMPKGSVSELQWRVNQVLHELARKEGIRLQSVRYGAPSREGTKASDIEMVDVEFQAIGVYQSLKKFMLAVEGSGLPFGVSSARLEESPEGARQTVILRAFRRTTAPADDAARGEA